MTKAFLRTDRGARVDVSAKNHLAVSFSMRVDKAPYPVEGGVGYVQIAAIELDPPPCDTSGGLKQRVIELSFYSGGSFGGALKGMHDLCPADAGDFVSMPTTYTAADFKQGFRATSHLRGTD